MNCTKYYLAGIINTTPSAKLIYLLLSELCDQNGEVIIPIRKISEALNLARDTVSSNLMRLERSGYIIITEQYNEYGGRAPNKYQLK